MAKYRLKPKALSDMESIWLYSQRTWGNEQANQYIDEIHNAFRLLTENPKLGVECNYIRTGYRRYSVFRHVIYYRLADFGLEVIRVLHDRMLASKNL